MWKKWWVVIAILALVMTGCLNSGVKVEVLYNDLAGIQKGDRVLRDNEAVGVVTKVDTDKAEDGSGSVFVTINQKKASGLTDNTRFYIDQDQEKQDRQAVVLEQYREGGKPLASGSVVQGSDRALSALHELADELGAGLGSLKAFFEGLKGDLEKATESDAAKKFETELRTLAEKMEKSSEKWRAQFQEEILPELQKQFEALRESMEELGQTEEIQRLKRQLERLSQT